MGVLKRLGSQNNQIRYTAVVACGHLKLRRGVPALTAMLIDGGDPLMRAAAAWALGRIKDHSSIPKLKSAAWGDIDPAVRAKAVASLAKMGIINVREGPFWDWEEYKSVRNGRSVGVAVLAGGGGAGLALVILGLLGGNDCSWATLINWGNQQDSQSCDDWQNLSIAGGVIAGLSVVIGMPITIYHSSQLRKLEAAYWSGIMPEPAVNVDKKGARLGLTWRF